jgi:hypothetical protein
MEHVDLGILMISISKIIEQYKKQVIMCRITQILFTGKINNISNDTLRIFVKYLQEADKSKSQTGGVSDNEKILNSLFLNEIRIFKELVFFTALQSYMMELIILLNQSHKKTQSNSQHGGLNMLNALKVAFGNISLVLLSSTSTLEPTHNLNMTNITNMTNIIQPSIVKEDINQTLIELSDKLSESVKNNDVTLFSHRKDSDINQAHTQLQTPETIGHFAKLFFKDTQQSSIKKTIKHFNENMTDITEECANECLKIMDDVMHKTTTFDDNLETLQLKESSSNSLFQLGNGILAMMTQSVSTITTSSNEQLKKTVESAIVKKQFSKYLNFVCHEAFSNTITYDGVNISMIGGNISYAQIQQHQTLLHEKMKDQIKREPNNKELKSASQRFFILTKLTDIFELEITSTFLSVSHKITGTNDVAIKFDKHLTNYVKSITTLIPYLKMMFPQDIMNAKTTAEFKQAEFEITEITSKANTKIVAQQTILDREASEILTLSRVGQLESTAKFARAMTNAGIGVAVAPITGAVEGITNATVETTNILTTGAENIFKTVLTGLTNMLYTVAWGPFGMMTLISLVFAGMCFLGGTAGFMYPFVFIPKTTHKIVKFAFGNIYYVFEKVGKRFIFRTTEPVQENETPLQTHRPTLLREASMLSTEREPLQLQSSLTHKSNSNTGWRRPITQEEEEIIPPPPPPPPHRSRWSTSKSDWLEKHILNNANARGPKRKTKRKHYKTRKHNKTRKYKRK